MSLERIHIHKYAMLCSSLFILLLYQPLANFPAAASPTHLYLALPLGS